MKWDGTTKKDQEFCTRENRLAYVAKKSVERQMRFCVLGRGRYLKKNQESTRGIPKRKPNSL